MAKPRKTAAGALRRRRADRGFAIMGGKWSVPASAETADSTAPAMAGSSLSGQEMVGENMVRAVSLKKTRAGAEDRPERSATGTIMPSPWTPGELVMRSKIGRANARRGCLPIPTPGAELSAKRSRKVPAIDRWRDEFQHLFYGRRRFLARILASRQRSFRPAQFIGSCSEGPAPRSDRDPSRWG